jgi:hypothetical protein
MLKQDDYQKAKLVECGWRFGKPYGGYKAGQLVMHTLMNRVRVGWGSNILQVIDAVPKFMAENELPALEHPPLWDAAFVKLLHSVEGIFDGSVLDESSGALYWGDLNHIERQWFRDKIILARKDDPNGQLVPAHQRVHDMGTLSFWA